MYKSILIPVDLGHQDTGDKAIRTAREISGPDTKIRLLTIIEDIPAFIASQIPEEIMEKNRADAGDAIRALAASDGKGLEIETEVRTGHPRVTILDVAEKRGADLIIMGSHEPGVQDLLLGSTAAHVVRHAKCSVLVVR